VTLTEDDQVLAPHDLDAERCVLGAMMMSPDAIVDVREVLKADDFYRATHQVIFEAIEEMYGAGEPVDFVTVHGRLDARGQSQRVGGVLALHGMVHETPSAANASYYAKIVQEKAKLRRLAEAGERARGWAYNPSGDTADDLVARVQEGLAEIAARRSTEGATPVGELLPDTLDEIEASANRGGKLTGIPTGFQDLDQLTNGWHAPQVIVIGARPAVGKSTLAADFARAAALKHGIPTVLFALEMGASEVIKRMLAAECKIPLHHITGGYLGDDAWTKMAKKLGEVGEAPLFIDDTAEVSISDIRAKSERLKNKYGQLLVIIDYIQLIPSPKKSESRQNDVSEISRAIKLMAKGLEVPVIVLSQLNRGVEQRQDKRPMLSDLRESGSIEQDADMVILLHREDANAKESPRAGEADLIVAKHRNGPTTTITVAFQGHYSRFVDMAPQGAA
jgi:replicative DNA helicase